MKEIVLPRPEKTARKAPGKGTKGAPPPPADRPRITTKSSHGKAGGQQSEPRIKPSANPLDPGFPDAPENRPPTTGLDSDRTPAASPHKPPAVSAHKLNVHVDIQLDPRITAGLMRDRNDIEISGVAIADQPIEAISLVLNDKVKALALYPNAAGLQKVFRLNLAQRQNLGAGVSCFDVVARIKGGEESRTPFQIATDHDDPRVARVMLGRTRELAAETTNLIPVLLYVEMAAVDVENVLHVTGWAVAQTQIVSVQASVGEQRVGFAQLGHPRDDIAAAYPAYVNARMSGFSLSRPLPVGETPTSVAVEVIAFCGSVSSVAVPIELGVPLPVKPRSAAVEVPKPQPRAPSDARRAIFLHHDEATLGTNGELLVSGWVVCATGVAEVTVSLDGETTGSAELGLPRLDVAEEYPGIAPG